MLQAVLHASFFVLRGRAVDSNPHLQALELRRAGGCHGSWRAALQCPITIAAIALQRAAPTPPGAIKPFFFCLLPAAEVLSQRSAASPVLRAAMNRRHEGPNGRSEEGGGGGEVSLGHGGGLGCVSPGTCAPSPFIPAGREADCLGVAVRLERCLCVPCERGVTAEQGSDGLSHRARPWAQAGGPSEEQGGFRGRIIGSQPAWVWRDLTAPQLWVGCPHWLTLPGAPSVPGLRATSSPMQPDFRTPSAAEMRRSAVPPGPAQPRPLRAPRCPYGHHSQGGDGSFLGEEHQIQPSFVPSHLHLQAFLSSAWLLCCSRSSSLTTWPW
eukprot:XP_024999417.1 succinate dehydrogenase cytochrome b560 subunit, mitochondrial isoform X1 [Gallus gallus]